MKALHARRVVLVLAVSLAIVSCDQPPSSPAAKSEEAKSDSRDASERQAANRAPMQANDTTAQTTARDVVPANESPLSLSGPRFREVTLPAGTSLPLRLETPVASDASSVDDPVRATLRTAVVFDGIEVLPAGAPLRGAVTAAERSGKVKGRAFVSFRFNELTLADEQYDMRTDAISRRAPATKAKDAKTIGIPAAGGAIVGGIIGGKKGAAIGGAAAGGAGTAVVLSTRGQEVRLAAGTTVTARLSEPLAVRVPVRP
jgi:hypothetical protein